MTLPPIVFPDIEAVVTAWGKATLPGYGITAKVATKMPDPRPAATVVVRHGGGAQRDAITDRPRVILECHAATEPAAADLAGRVRALLSAAAPGYLTAGVWCDQIVDMGIAKSQDPNTGTPRYLVTAELHVTGRSL
ncbi:hypothetical protein [Nocardia sp. NPDC059239]|uniref:hypothetical protein n=1 Tax=unclassified Nocardia TaxID=2637762 RepID=UPI0036908FC7